MEKHVRTFGIDIDEVLRSLLSEMINLYNKHVDEDKRVSAEDITDFRVDKSFPEIANKGLSGSTSEWFFQTNGHMLFRESGVIPGAVEAINRLREKGKVILISYQKSVDNKIDTLKWLEEHGIEYDGVCFIKDKSFVHTDWLIDDNDWNFIGSNARIGALINAPYNKNVNIQDLKAKSHCMNILRFNSLLDFANWHDKMYGKE